MDFCFKTIIYCCIFLVISIPAFTQVNTVHAEDVTGKISGIEPGVFLRKLMQ
jgi:hypothetical protein